VFFYCCGASECFSTVVVLASAWYSIFLIFYAFFFAVLSSAFYFSIACLGCARIGCSGFAHFGCSGFAYGSSFCVLACVCCFALAFARLHRCCSWRCWWLLLLFAFAFLLYGFCCLAVRNDF
jgi:hypothetical protein